MKIDIDSKISSVKDEVTTVKKSVEVVSFFSKYPKLLIILGVGLIFLIGFALGNSQLLNLFKMA